MADRLKGITVEIAGDTTGLNKALKNVNQESRALQNELSDVERLLKFNPDNAELLAQRQQLLNRQIETTSNKLTQLKHAEQQVQQQFERGEIGADQFRAFQREIIATEGRLQHFQRQAEGTSRDVKAEFKNMGSGLASSIAGAATGVGIGTIVSKALETAHLETQIGVGFDVPEEDISKVREIITGITAYGLDQEEVVAGLRKQIALNGDQSIAQNKKIAESAAVIAKTYDGLDFTELIQESNEFAEAVGVTQEEALGMTNSLLKAGFPPDQLDIMAEYGAQLHRAGYNAQEIQGIFAAGVETKSWNIDVLLDGVKEGRIRLAEFGQGVDKTTAGLIKGTDISSERLKAWGNAITEGGDAGKIAFGEVATELGKVDDENQRNAIGTRLFGTLWEEQGKKITDSLAGANSKTGDLKKNTDELRKAREKYNNDPEVQLNKALDEMNKKLAPLLKLVAEFVTKIAEWVQANPGWTAAILAVVVAIGLITGVIIFLLPVIALLTAENLALAASLFPVILPFLLIAAAIAAAIVVTILIRKNWDKIMQKAHELGRTIKKAFTEFTTAAKGKMEDARIKISNTWEKVMKFFRGISLKKIGSDIIKGLVKGMSNMFEKVKEKARDIGETVRKALKDKLKLGSPSKVTEEMGEFTGEGMVIGLRNSLSKVNEMSTKLAKAAIPQAAAAPAAAPVSGGKSMTVNFHSPKALDLREANKEFNRTFNKMSLMW